MKQYYKVLFITLMILTCIYVGGILFGSVDANTTQQCIPNSERRIGSECLPRENIPICPKRKPPCSLIAE